MTQGAQPGALGQPRGMGGSFKREGPYVYLWLIHVDVWQKPTQYCKAFIFQIKRGKKKSKTVEFSEFLKEIFYLGRSWLWIPVGETGWTQELRSHRFCDSVKGLELTHICVGFLVPSGLPPTDSRFFTLLWADDQSQRNWETMVSDHRQWGAVDSFSEGAVGAFWYNKLKFCYQEPFSAIL